MPCPYHHREICAGGDQPERSLHFVEGSESIARAVNEERGDLNRSEVARAQLLRLVRWMQRIGEQQQRIGNVGLFRGEHGRLPASVGMAAEEDFLSADFSQCFHGAAQSLAVAFGLRWKWWTFRTLLAKWKIAAQRHDARVRKGFRDRFEQRSITVAARAVRDHQTVAVGVFGLMNKSSNQFALKMFQSQFLLFPRRFAGRRRYKLQFQDTE